MSSSTSLRWSVSSSTCHSARLCLPPLDLSAARYLGIVVSVLVLLALMLSNYVALFLPGSRAPWLLSDHAFYSDPVRTLPLLVACSLALRIAGSVAPS